MNQVKNLFTILLLTGLFSVVNAQDIITKKNGDEIRAKILDVGVNDVKYKRFGNDSGPSYTLSKSEIFMIKYENGEKDMFEKASEENTPKETSSGEALRKGYVGLSVGGAFLTESYDNVDNGVQVNFNFGYLFTKNIGIASTIFSTSFDLSNYNDASIGLVGFLVGPQISTAIESGRFEFDLKPMLGFSSGSVTINDKSDTTDETSFSVGVGGSFRWNCAKRVSVSGHIDYYSGKINDVDLSSYGIGVGVNFRF